MRVCEKDKDKSKVDKFKTKKSCSDRCIKHGSHTDRCIKERLKSKLSSASFKEKKSCSDRCIKNKSHTERCIKDRIDKEMRSLRKERKSSNIERDKEKSKDKSHSKDLKDLIESDKKKRCLECGARFRKNEDMWQHCVAKSHKIDKGNFHFVQIINNCHIVKKYADKKYIEWELRRRQTRKPSQNIK